MRAERPGLKKQQALRDAIAIAQGYKSHEDAVKALAKEKRKKSKGG